MYIVSIQRTEKKHCIAASDEEWKNGFIDWVDKIEILLNGKKQWKTDILSANPDSAPSNTLLFFLGSPVNSPLAGEEGPSGIKTTLCPVCEEVIHGNGDELNSHVEACLRKVRAFNGKPVTTLLQF